jgi:hypothetical protein
MDPSLNQDAFLICDCGGVCRYAPTSPVYELLKRTPDSRSVCTAYTPWPRSTRNVRVGTHSNKWAYGIAAALNHLVS